MKMDRGAWMLVLLAAPPGGMAGLLAGERWGDWPGMLIGGAVAGCIAAAASRFIRRR